MDFKGPATIVAAIALASIVNRMLGLDQFVGRMGIAA